MSFDFKITQGDIKIGDDGDLAKVENTEKLIQDILKIATTRLGANQFYKWYGSPISNTLVGSVMDMEFTSTMASSQLQHSLEVLQKMQQEQIRRQSVTPAEQLAAIKEVKISRNTTDPRYFRIKIFVLSRALTDVQTEFSVRGL